VNVTQLRRAVAVAVAHRSAARREMWPTSRRQFRDDPRPHGGVTSGA
jgi:hypothetical protein